MTLSLKLLKLQPTLNKIRNAQCAMRNYAVKHNKTVTVLHAVKRNYTDTELHAKKFIQKK